MKKIYIKALLATFITFGGSNLYASKVFLPEEEQTLNYLLKGSNLQIEDSSINKIYSKIREMSIDQINEIENNRNNIIGNPGNRELPGPVLESIFSILGNVQAPKIASIFEAINVLDSSDNFLMPKRESLISTLAQHLNINDNAEDLILLAKKVKSVLLGNENQDTINELTSFLSKNDMITIESLEESKGFLFHQSLNDSQKFDIIYYLKGSFPVNRLDDLFKNAKKIFGENPVNKSRLDTYNIIVNLQSLSDDEFNEVITNPKFFGKAKTLPSRLKKIKDLIKKRNSGPSQ